MRTLINLLFWAIKPFSIMGGGGGDGGAAAARKQEEERQARIKAAVDRINAVFNNEGKAYGANAATVFDPNAKYYTAEGEEWSTPTKTVGGNVKYVRGRGVVRRGANKVLDQDAINRQIKEGKLFRTLEHTPINAKSRDQLYTEQKQAVTDINKLDVTRQQTEAERQNRFGLARSGLMGGSADIDSNFDIQERTNKGLIQAAALGDKAAAELKMQDERARQSLIGQAQAGIDVGTAQSMAMGHLNAAAQSAAGQRNDATIGNLFGDMSQAYLMRQYRQGMQAGRNYQYPTVSSTQRGGDSGTINQ
jgi:hypothetical protein